MKAYAEKVVAAAKSAGASYADARWAELRSESITVKNGDLRQLRQNVSSGVGIRVLVDGAWGFFATANTDDASLKACAERAVEIARASAKVNREPVELAPNPTHRDTYRSQVERDPFSVPTTEKVQRLQEANAHITGVQGVAIAETTMDFNRIHQFYIDSEGADIEQQFTFSGVGATAGAIGKGEYQQRSYPNSFRGQFRQAGYEHVEPYLQPDDLQRIGQEAVALLSAKQCPQGQMDIVVGSAQMALQIHESCGHPIEFDRILGQERNFAGESFMTPEHLGQLRYGSDLVNLYADGGEPGGLGSFGYDDEGVKAVKYDVVKDGILMNFLLSRDTASVLGRESNASMRAESWSTVPIIRMTNISLSPGDQSFDDLIGGIDNGLYLETNRTWSIDNYRKNFQFGCEMAHEIKNGKLGELVKNAQYTGMTTDFWNSCTGVGNADTWNLWGVPNCGKGQPMQIARVSHGAPATRFSNVQVGVGYA